MYFAEVVLKKKGVIFTFNLYQKKAFKVTQF